MTEAPYLAYFFDRRSIYVDGWKNRLTVPCDARGRLSQPDYERVQGWSYIGHYQIGKTPDNVWLKAREPRCK